MRLILTHENADFDAVASQLAAHKLHPDSIPLLSRRVNRNVNQFLTLYWDALPFMRVSAWRRQRVEQIILVDTQSVPSVRGVRPHTPVMVIDHHTPDENLDESWETTIEPVGAATTLGVEMLQAQGLTPTTIEATLLLLGIYEDTGTLTYDTTTSRDVRAAAWLLEHEAQLPIVRRFLDVPFSEAQQALYRQLQLNAEWLKIEGHSIVLAAVQAPADFAEEISAIAHRMRDALAPAGLVILVGFPHHVQLVARSTTDHIDVSELARAFGGGGHGRAAAATIMETSLEEAEAKVRQLLPRAVRPAIKVAELMSRGVKTITAQETVLRAGHEMQRYGHEGYPVLDAQSGRLVGLLTRRAVDRALSHDLGRLQVGQVMKSGRVFVYPDEPVERVQQLMIAEDWGQVPVIARSKPGEENGRDNLLGIITRTDLLRLLSQPPEDEDKGNLRRQLASGLPPAHWQMVQVVSEVADEAVMPIYFVGGLVRDLLLNLPAVDMDIVVEGDAIELAHQLAKKYGGRVRSHGRFGTAKWLLTPKVWAAIAPNVPTEGAAESVDFVTARTEFYTQPSALPQVTHGSIKLDLHRRDFTINTLAIRLDGPHLGDLLDFYGGLRDLDQGLIRVLHSLSFIDDPTRILRAVRLEQRLGFQIEPRTAELITNALPVLERVTGARIRHEIELALEEAQPVPVLERMASIGALAAIHPSLSWNEETAQAFGRLQTLLANDEWTTATQDRLPTSVYFSLWLLPLSSEEQHEVMERLKVRKSTRDEVEGVSELVQALQALPADARPSEVEKTIRPYAAWPRILLAVRAAVGDSPAGELLDRYWREWRHVQTAVDGNDLRQLGLKPGPQYTLLLDRLLAARLDGEVSNEAEERALLQRLLQEKA